MGEKKNFYCIEMKRKIQEDIYEEMKGMTPEEYAAYIHQRIINSQFKWFLEEEPKGDKRSYSAEIKSVLGNKL